MEEANMKQKRILLSAAGVIISAVCVGAFKLAAMGVDPFQSLMSGLDALIPIPFGTLYVIVNAVLLLFALCFDRHYIGVATFVNLFLLGYVVEFSYATLQAIFPAPGMLVRIISFIFGFVFLCLGSSLYITADMGVSTYDAIALIVSETWKKGKFKYVRIATDLVCIVLGIAMYLISGGAPSGITAFVGLGTVLTAFFMGPLIDFFNRKIAIPLLGSEEA
ncbi:MAG: hypothetical protein IKB82_06060 [Clostridia bacterium]|nr:hypothetical protein [Clostridia bacterium]